MPLIYTGVSENRHYAICFEEYGVFHMLDTFLHYTFKINSSITKPVILSGNKYHCFGDFIYEIIVLHKMA